MISLLPIVLISFSNWFFCFENPFLRKRKLYRQLFGSTINSFHKIWRHHTYLPKTPREWYCIKETTQYFYTTLQTPNVFMSLCNHPMFLWHLATTYVFYATLQVPNAFFVTMQLPNVFTSPWNHEMFLCHFATIYGTLNKLNAYMQLCNHPMFFHHFTTTRCFYAAVQSLNKCMNASVNPSQYFCEIIKWCEFLTGSVKWNTLTNL